MQNQFDSQQPDPEFESKLAYMIIRVTQGQPNPYATDSFDYEIYNALVNAAQSHPISPNDPTLYTVLKGLGLTDDQLNKVSSELNKVAEFCDRAGINPELGTQLATRFLCSIENSRSKKDLEIKGYVDNRIAALSLGNKAVLGTLILICSFVLVIAENDDENKFYYLQQTFTSCFLDLALTYSAHPDKRKHVTMDAYKFLEKILMPQSFRNTKVTPAARQAFYQELGATLRYVLMVYVFIVNEFAQSYSDVVPQDILSLIVTNLIDQLEDFCHATVQCTHEEFEAFLEWCREVLIYRIQHNINIYANFSEAAEPEPEPEQMPEPVSHSLGECK